MARRAFLHRTGISVANGAWPTWGKVAPGNRGSLMTHSGNVRLGSLFRKQTNAPILPGANF